VELPIEIDCPSVQSLREGGGDFLLVDCREPDEWQLVRIAGATHIPMDQIVARREEFEPHRQKRIVVHCHHGGRSRKVVQWLRQQGFSQAQNMTGGIDAWACEVDPSLARY
jgi:rhodanese-related sulfurtransferase